MTETKRAAPGEGDPLQNLLPDSSPSTPEIATSTIASAVTIVIGGPPTAKGRPRMTRVVVTVSKIEIEDVGDDRKAIAYFVGKEKGLVLNRTNWDRIALAAGTDETDEWPGVKVQLYTEPVTFNGKTAPAIRVKAVKKRSTSQAQDPRPTPPHTDDDIPF